MCEFPIEECIVTAISFCRYLHWVWLRSCCLPDLCTPLGIQITLLYRGCICPSQIYLKIVVRQLRSGGWSFVLPIKLQILLDGKLSAIFAPSKTLCSQFETQLQHHALHKALLWAKSFLQSSLRSEDGWELSEADSTNEGVKHCVRTFQWRNLNYTHLNECWRCLGAVERNL